MGYQRKEKGATKTTMTRQVPRSLLLKMVTAETQQRRQLKAFYAKWYGLFFLLGWIAGYAHAMILITDNFFWLPWNDYEITVKPPTNK